jgi:hypothetical protein
MHILCEIFANCDLFQLNYDALFLNVAFSFEMYLSTSFFFFCINGVSLNFFSLPFYGVALYK